MTQAQQPEALRLTDNLEGNRCHRAAAMLRTQHARIAELEAAPAAQAVEPAVVVPGQRVTVNAGALQMVVNALRRDAAEGKTARDEMADELLATVAPAPAAVAVPGGWQPISAAPKSGRTLILGFFNESGKWRTTRGQWFTQEHIDDTWEDADDCKAGWYETPVVGDDCYPVAPTHWMPLPAEPGAAPQAQDVQRDADIQRAVLAERERICAAIKAEDDHCVTQGDYMLDSEDCIKVVRGEWVRPVYEIGSAAQKGQA